MYHFKYRAMLCCLCVDESNELARRAIVHRIEDIAVILMNEKIVGLDNVKRRVKVCNLVLDRVGINVDLQKFIEIHGNPPIKWYYSVLKVTHSSHFTRRAIETDTQNRRGFSPTYRARITVA